MIKFSFISPFYFAELMLPKKYLSGAQKRKKRKREDQFIEPCITRARRVEFAQGRSKS
jgi:hypothetical protein